MSILIRPASPADAQALLAIYTPYVVQTAITFEYDVPTPVEFTARIAATLEKYPYLVAEQDGVPVGYAYAGAFHERAAYDWSVETSIYVEQHQKGNRPAASQCPGAGIAAAAFSQHECLYCLPSGRTRPVPHQGQHPVS